MAHPAAACVSSGGGRTWLRIKPFRKNWNRSASSAARSVLVNLNLNRCSSLGALPSPLWGGVGGGGGAMFLRWRHPHLAASPPSPALPHKGGGSTPSAERERTGSAGPASRRQQRAEAAGHGARADARGAIDQALALEPGLELRRRAALQEIAHGERVVERRALIAEHDVVGAGHAHHEVDAGGGEQGQ